MVRAIFHTDIVEGELVVWAESPDVPGLSVAGESVSEVREALRELLLLDGRGDVVTKESLADAQDRPVFWRRFLVQGETSVTVHNWSIDDVNIEQSIVRDPVLVMD